MITFETLILRFEQMGEKTGWTYIRITESLANQLKPGTRTSYRVKGFLDSFPIKQAAIMPMGDGDFILAINATMRRGIRKGEGEKISVKIEVDESEAPVNQDFLDCLQDLPEAKAFFESLPKGHQRYYHNWINQGKSIETQSKRIMQSIEGFDKKLGYGEMIRYFKALKNQE